jgi:hypothetical protein
VLGVCVFVPPPPPPPVIMMMRLGF